MMKNRLESILIDCLHGTLNILVCSSSVSLTATMERLLSRYPLFTPCTAATPDAIKKHLTTTLHWHVVILDERFEHATECLELLGRKINWVPLIHLVDPRSAEDLWRVTIHNKEKLDQQNEPPVKSVGPIKGVDLYAICPLSKPTLMLPALQVLAIKRKLFSRNPSGVVCEAADVLFKENPESVKKWSDLLQTKQRQFQRQFKLYSNYSPKKLLSLYHVYRIAFSMIDEIIEMKRGAFPAYVIDHESKERLVEYVLTRRSSLLASSN